MNIRKIFDIVYCAREQESPILILQADLVKAFDRVEMTAICGTLKYFGFSQYLIDWMDILYENFQVRVLNNGNLSEPIKIERSVHQGGCASAIIFVCIAEILARDIRSDVKIKGAFIKEIENLLNLFADDTDVSLDGENANSLQGVLNHINNFGKKTGLLLNYDKTSVYRFGSLQNTNAKYYTDRELNWKDGVMEVLGVKVSSNQEEAISINYEKICDSAEKVLESWRRRTLSLHGKINVINTLIGSLFVYCMTVLPPITEKYINRMERMMVKFLWNGHRPKISMETLQNDKNSGGLRLVNLRKKDEPLKDKNTVQRHTNCKDSTCDFGTCNGI